jgi:hypothetical protein
MPSTIYATLDTLDHLVPADRWMAQTGNRWMAVAPFESAESWFEGEYLDFAPQLVRPINDIPPSGTLVWRDLEAGQVEVSAETAAIMLRDIATPIEAMARAMAEIEDDDCFKVADTWHQSTSEKPAGIEEDCRYWIRLASAAWTASRPVPASGAHS